MTTLNFNLQHTIDAAAIRIGNTRDEIMDFIVDLDLSVAESDFTEDLVIKLIESLEIESVASIREKVAAILQRLEGLES